MDFWHSLGGMITLKVLSADISVFLGILQDNGIIIYRGKVIDELQMQFQVSREQLNEVIALSEKHDAQATVLSREGIFWRLNGLLHRPVLLSGVLMLILLTILLPTRVFFFVVDGNRNVPTNLILERAEFCGMYFGVPRSEIRSEKVKNAVLQAIPELEWVGINTSGCVATISVRERQENTPRFPERGVSSIVSTGDGVITRISAIAGNQVVKQGDAVKRGQVLISGYTDCGLKIAATRAKGEVYAQTNRTLSLVRTKQAVIRGRILSKTKKYGVKIGKNRINFYQGSGILGTSCVKMYEENYVTLPGGFQLPIAIVTETWILYEESTPAVSSVGAESSLSDYAASYLREQMIAGSILSQKENFEERDSILLLKGQYLCEEMIGQERSEEIYTP